MLLKKISLLFSCSLLLLTAKGQQTAPEKSSLLWEISGKGLQSPSWLYGTIHAICPDDHHFSSAALDALKQSKALYLEVNIDDKQEVGRIQSAALMPEPYSFKALFAAADYAKMSTWFHDSLNIELAQLDKLKPLIIYSIMLQKFAATTCDRPVSTEVELVKLAKAQQLPIKGLEAILDQLAMFDSIPDTEEAAMMLKSITDTAKSREDYRRMVSAYKQGDIRLLYNQIVQMEDMLRYKELLLDRRNRNWISIISSEAAKAPTFFAVGAGHLGGNIGVIELLRKEGYTVKPVL
ncbi:TraB/GumN family protein [Chitinophaga filiformis]|uniref:TraB/GumN family protein n=1 Tax=Chitinophaga filiformis TaxID=104663 RepID=UPI001F196060|nr:TraB/GumN family protein [Chitinophaga filiformis]MCF6407394.1 TraB/GumN family protein [Chitinophaga filiformis]